MKLGVIVESFRKDFRASVESAAAIGAQGIQKYAVGDEVNWSDEKIREVLDMVKSNGLVFSALCGDFGHGFGNAELNPQLIEKSKRVIDLAKKLECNIVTTHIGTVPEEENAQKEVMRKACRELALYADSVDAKFAMETGPETGKVLGEFLDSLGAGGVCVNFDPANLVMLSDERPEEALKYLGKYVVHTHAKDGVMLKKRVEKAIEIGEEAKEHAALLNMGQTFLEMPLGEGDVDFDIYLPALKATGYDGFLTIEREVGNNPEADIIMAADFLREKMAKFGL